MTSLDSPLDDDPLSRTSARSLDPDDLARLRRERAEAYGAYDDALKALDAAIRELERPIQALGARQPETVVVEAPPEPLPRGWRARVKRPIVRWILRRLVTSLAGHAQYPAIKLAVRRIMWISADDELDRLNRLNQLTDQLTDRLNQLTACQSPLTEFLQKIRRSLDMRDQLNMRIQAGALEALVDEVRKRWTSTAAQERRLIAQVDDLRSTTAAAHRLALSLKREQDRAAAPAGIAVPDPASNQRPAALDSHTYVGFEDAFRGSTHSVRARLESYLPHFEGASDVVDAGCGRGEFLRLLREHGVAARGVDTNREMVAECLADGLMVEEDDLLTYLQRQPAESLGGLFASQVVEHLPPDHLIRTLDAAYQALRPGAKVVLETINVASWSAFFHSYVRDVTHRVPLHPDTLQYLVTAAGFQKVAVEFTSPCTERLDQVAVPAAAAGADPTATAFRNLALVLNENVERLNALLFADQDYAVIGERP